MFGAAMPARGTTVRQQMSSWPVLQPRPAGSATRSRRTVYTGALICGHWPGFAASNDNYLDWTRRRCRCLPHNNLRRRPRTSLRFIYLTLVSAAAALAGTGFEGRSLSVRPNCSAWRLSSALLLQELNTHQYMSTVARRRFEGQMPRRPGRRRSSSLTAVKQAFRAPAALALSLIHI